MSDSVQINPLSSATATGKDDPYTKNIKDITSAISIGRDARLALGDRLTAAENALAAMSALVAKFNALPTFGKVNVKQPMPAISLTVASIGPSIAMTAPGVKLGDFIRVAFDGAPPGNLTIVGEVVTADATVLVTFAATALVNLSAGTRSFNVSYWRY